VYKNQLRIAEKFGWYFKFKETVETIAVKNNELCYWYTETPRK
jgi:hypothetical protein